jgi:multicomponent K+:H+ antiporter subunit A
VLPVLVSIVALPFLGAAIALALSPRAAGRVALIPPALVLALALPRWPTATESVAIRVPWIPSLGVTASVVWDRFGAFFVVLVAGVGLAVVQYSRAYFGSRSTSGYWATLLAFMGAMLGVVVSDSLISMFLFWEITTVTSALLIAFDVTDPDARRAAVRAFLVTDAGSLAMLAGVVLLGEQAGTYDLSRLAARASSIVASPGHVLPMVLILVGAFAKSAQFPFHFWLPGAMAAPAPVSAYLHSATMVKAGIFLMGRLFPVFHASPVWRPLLVTVGLVTFVTAGWDAVRAWDLKKLLAYSTVAYLGVLTALYGLYAHAGTRGELGSIANHALYKSALFLLVGWMEKVTGTRDLSVLKEEHWFRREPVAGVLIGIGAFAMAGFPLVLGFISKEVLFQALLAGRSLALRAALVAAIVGGSFAATYALKLFVSTFWGPEIPPEERGRPRREISRWLLIVPGLLLAPQVVGGLAPGWVLGPVSEPGIEWPRWLAIWHHVDTLFALSVTTIALGLLGYVAWRRIARPPREPETQILSDRLAAAILTLAGEASVVAQEGGRPRYLAITIATALLAAGAAAWAGAIAPPLASGPELATAWLPTGMIVCGALATPFVPGRAAKVVTLAIAGYGVAVFFVLFRAPDLVLTQILVETVTLVLLLLVLARIGRLTDDARPRRARAAIAVASGLGALALTWGAGASRAPSPSGRAQLALALPGGGGRNAVNVILVDMRGADTLGEITVLAIAALGVGALLSGRRERA